MATRDPRRVPDGIRATPRGVNSGQGPETIGREYIAFLVNGTVRGGYVSPRPGVKKLELDYGGNESLQDGLFQGASYYKPRNGSPVLIAQISGRLYRFDVSQFNNPVTDISIQVNIGGVLQFDYNSAIMRQAWMLQVEDWLIVQNNLQRPVFYDGNTSRRAGNGELPPGNVMEYSMGRVWMALTDRQSFIAGDLVYGPSGSLAYNFRDAVLKVTENDFLNEGGEFTVPINAGPINAMRNIAILDTSMGQGPLQVFTERAVFSINAPVDRTTWKDLTYPIATVSGIGNGALSQDGTVTINGDIWFRSKDGLRSFVLAMRQFNEFGNVPMSREMSRVIDADNRRLLGYNSAILFDNRYLTTCSPGNSFLHGTFHRGVIALDFDIVSSMSNRLPPAYDGLWTGIRILKLVSGDFGGVDRAFAFVLSSADKIEIWEITRNDIFDNTSRRIEMVLETPAFFGGLELLKLNGGDMFIDQLSGRTDFNVKYRPDQYADWFDWHSWSECANYQTCTLENCAVPGNLQKQYRARMRLPNDPPQVCSTEDNRPSNLGYHFQVRVKVTGSARLKALGIQAYIQEEEPYGQCRSEGTCISTNVCQLPLFDYSAEVT